jgi:hypothetical protein
MTAPTARDGTANEAGCNVPKEDNMNCKAGPVVCTAGAEVVTLCAVAAGASRAKVPNKVAVFQKVDMVQNSQTESGTGP